MVFAIATLFFQFASTQPLPDVAVGAVASIVKSAPADAKPVDQPKAAIAPSAKQDSTGSPTGTALTAVAFESSSANSQSLSTIRVPDLTPSKPERVISPDVYPRRNWLLLSAAEHSAATFDAYSTRAAISVGATEGDPFMRPFAHSSAIYAAIQVGPVILDYAARRMQRSQNSFLRRAWFVPQSAATGMFLFSGAHNMHIANAH